MLKRLHKLLVVIVVLSASVLATFVPHSVAHAYYPNTYNLPSTWWSGPDCDATSFDTSAHKLLTTWMGIQICGEGPTQGGSDVAVQFPGETTAAENEWECTELVKRYLYIAYGANALTSTWGYNLVDQYVSHYSSKFTKVTNDGTATVLPKVGDVLSYNEVGTPLPGDGGHTAIIISFGLDGSTGYDIAHIIEENASTTGVSTQRFDPSTMKFLNGIDNSSSDTGHTVEAWLTSKTPPAWSTFGYDTAHTHNNTVENILTASNVSSIVQNWTGATSGVINSSPTVVSGVLYIGSDDHKLYAFDAAGFDPTAGHNCTSGTCSPLWTASTGGAIDSSPTVSGGVVYVGSSDHKLYAFDANGITNCTYSSGNTTCTPLWYATTGSAVVSSPTVSGSVVYVGSEDDKLYAYSTSGCTTSPCSALWTATTGGSIDSSPTVSGGVVYVGSYDQKLYAYDASGVTNCSGGTCSPLWYATTADVIGSTPAVANSVVYINSADGTLYAFSTSGCTTSPCSALWTASAGGSGNYNSPAVANGTVYLGASSNAGSGIGLFAFNASGCGSSTCSPSWRGNTSGSSAGVIDNSAATIVNGMVFIGAQNDKLFAFNTSGCTTSPCSPLWSATLGGAIASSPTVLNGEVYIGTNDDKVYAFGF